MKRAMKVLANVRVQSKKKVEKEADGESNVLSEGTEIFMSA